LVGVACVASVCAVGVWGPLSVAVCALSACPSIVCVTSPLSPGLSIRTVTARLAAPDCVAVAVSAGATIVLVSAAVVSGAVGAETVGSAGGAGAAGTAVASSA
jgi:hypothetical protein